MFQSEGHNPLKNCELVYSSYYFKWPKVADAVIEACNDNTYGESKGQNSHESLLGSHSSSLLLTLRNQFTDT